MAESIKKSKVAQEVVRAKKPSIPTTNAWSKKFVPTLEDFPQNPSGDRSSCPPPPITAYRGGGETSDLTAETCFHQGCSSWSHTQSNHSSGENAPETHNTQGQRNGIALLNPSQTSLPQEIELEAIMIALNGASALLKKITTGSASLISALRKMMEAALDAINTLTV